MTADPHDPDPFRLTRCAECGYDLTGSPQPGRCPECGWYIDITTIEIPIIRTTNGASNAARVLDVVSMFCMLVWFVILPLDLLPRLWWLSPGSFLGWLGAVWITARVIRFFYRRAHRAPRPVLMSTATALFVRRGTVTIARYPWRLFENVKLIQRAMTGRLVLVFHDRLGPSMSAELATDAPSAERARAALEQRIDEARQRGASRSEIEIDADAPSIR